MAFTNSHFILFSFLHCWRFFIPHSFRQICLSFFSSFETSKPERRLLSCHQVFIALEEDISKWTEEQTKKKVQIRSDAYFLIIVSLIKNVIRRVGKTKTLIELWNKLEPMYRNILAPNLAYLKANLCAFRFDIAKSVDENLDEFLKITDLLDGTEQVVDETSQVMILINDLPNSYHVVRMPFRVSSLDLFDGLYLLLLCFHCT